MSPAQPMVYVLLSFLLIFTAIGAILERPTFVLRSPQFDHNFGAKLWALSIIPAFAFSYLAYLSGGFNSYLETVENRVIAFAGMGALIVAVKAITSINCVYFVYLLASRRRSRTDWLLFLAHFLLSSAIALLTGSRNTLLVSAVIMLLAVPVFTRFRVKVAHAVAAFLLLVVSLIALGEIRNQLDELQQGGDITYSDEPFFRSKSLYYGVTSVENVYASPPYSLENGRTFLSGATTFVPRAWWPAKPDGGGEVYTRQYYGGKWGGASRESPGIFAESVMNFGVAAGTGFALFLMLILILSLSRWYHRISASVCVKPERFLLYAYALIFVCNLPFAEFATALNNFVTRGVLAAGIALLVRKRLVFGRN